MLWMLAHWRSYAQTILNPPQCVFCQCNLYERSHWCTSCAQKIQPIASKNFDLTKTHYITVYAGAAYTEPFKKLMMCKHHRSIAGCYPLAHVIGQRTPYQSMPCDYLIPIPLHWTRAINRGFNQSTEIAKLLQCYRTAPVHHLLTRTRATKFQASVSAQERKTNVQDAFALTVADKHATLYQNKHLVLVDDLVTTGNTLIQAAHTLQALKPASISALVACRAILE